MRTWVSANFPGHVTLILFCVLCYRGLLCAHYYLDTVKLPLVFIAFYILEQRHEFECLQRAELFVEILPFGLQ